VERFWDATRVASAPRIWKSHRSLDGDELGAGLHEALLTERLELALQRLDLARVEPLIDELDAGSAADRLSRHLALLIGGAIGAADDEERTRHAVDIAEAIASALIETGTDEGVLLDVPLRPARVLRAIYSRNPDGSAKRIDAPLTPLLDTTVLTNAPGEPAVGHELRAEIASSDGIDLVMAFIRWSGVRPLADAIAAYCAAGNAFRVLTTTYSNSTEKRALDVLREAGAEIRVSYDTSQTRLHAKAWIFRRQSGYSTAYIGSSNLTHTAQVTGLEWNVRISGARNPDALDKMQAVFESYWASDTFVAYDPDDFVERTAIIEADRFLLSPIEIEPRPFQEALLEQLELAREKGHHHNLLVAATGTGKTVIAAVDYARLRSRLPRARLLFVAHRKEILEQSLATYKHAVRDASFGELWVGDARPSRFEHVFASVQSLNAAGLDALDRDHFDVVVVDEFHHAPAPSYARILEHLQPRELLGLTATPERSDGLDVLRFFDGRIAAELRLWDAIDQQYLAPFAYYGVHDGLDLRNVPWRRGTGYDVTALTNVMTADHVWARRVIEKVGQYVRDAHSMRALGFCVSVDHARFMAAQFNEAGVKAAAVSGESDASDRRAGLDGLRDGSLQIVFSVDLFNEGIDVRDVDTLLLLRPTDSPVLFIQQLGRGLRKADGKICTVLDFVGTHRKEFRFDRRYRALLGGSRSDLQRQIEHSFPFLPAGCHLELEPIAREVVLRSLRDAIPSDWRSRQEELAALGDVSLSTFLRESGLELDDIYANNRSWSALRRAVHLPGAAPGPGEDLLLRAIGRLLHVDDPRRIAAYSDFFSQPSPPDPLTLAEEDRRLLRMAAASISTAATLDQALAHIWSHPQVLSELRETLVLLADRVNHVTPPLGLADVPLRLHARYTRTEILAAFGAGANAKLPEWREGVRWDEASGTDLFAFTLDKSNGNFSPTTRYRDYAISPTLIHWESQSTTSTASPVGQRYINHLERGTNIVLFARLRTSERAFWCLGPASYVRHEGERPIAFVWKLEQRLPADLYSQFAAVAA
jgi:superfamily II DNA or RNA helicase/HKD family nuclease